MTTSSRSISPPSAPSFLSPSLGSPFVRRCSIGGERSLYLKKTIVFCWLAGKADRPKDVVGWVGCREKPIELFCSPSVGFFFRCLFSPYPCLEVLDKVTCLPSISGIGETQEIPPPRDVFLQICRSNEQTRQSRDLRLIETWQIKTCHADQTRQIQLIFYFFPPDRDGLGRGKKNTMTPDVTCHLQTCVNTGKDFQYQLTVSTAAISSCFMRFV